ncbi:helix-turn-helix domain-containing protein [Prosthecobacter sp.]|jgi:AraC-like DNA-binding protein|uniref:AraC family transcriptional regulator n=1 Tax=Prosthecobacter sp. TaxID=1965333 RepID=UPI00378362AC
MKPLQKAFLTELADLGQLLDPLERIPGAMFMIKDLDSRYLYMSQALRRVIHLPDNLEIIGKTDFDLFPKIIAQSFRQNDLQVFKHGRPLLNEVHAVGFFAHAMKWAYSSKFPLRDHKGKVIGLITINEEYKDVMGQEAELNRLLPAIEHIAKHYAESITIAQLATRCSFSESHFARIFKQRMKMTAYAFVEQVRMFHAIDAIRHTAASVATIAADCGFYDPSSFVKRFKKFTGSTPLKYRREHQARRERALALPEALA